MSSRFLNFHSVELRVRMEPFTHREEFQWELFCAFWYFILQTMRKNHIFSLLLLMLWISLSHRASGIQLLQIQAPDYKNCIYFSLISLHHLQAHKWQRKPP